MKRYIVIYQNQKTGKVDTMTCTTHDPCEAAGKVYDFLVTIFPGQEFLILSITFIPEIKEEE